jgi:catechol 2,3-dioxygenase-like lactoylglutathione lyase family enzyme
MEPAPRLHRIVISTSKIADALAFYRTLLGLEVVSDAGGLAMLRFADGIEILLHERQADPSDTAVCLSLRVADLHGTVDAWRGLGGVVVDPPARQSWGESMAMVRDADGHLVCLTSA